ncbi:lipopolysaccharide biosynthesis protein [Pontibacter silvestris]|uniref:Lipopolysaccharide biosynthesis protein n=1 Tax=Pontibacter silvestris TaxID=2305183 RepID=A0ABW4WV14_9BACT|nr:oligosaccharide flippase family protein [Pontibacter silvestris]MCC9137296.1 oligosaccharide flippase family protein [Pontibacter silvestris]
MFRKLLSHAAIYGLAAQIPRLAGVFTLPIVTRYLITTDYGVAGVVTAYIVALNMLQSLGLTVVMVNSFAHYPIRYKWVWRQLNGFLTLWSLVYGVMVGVVLYLVIPPEAEEHRIQISLLYCLPTMVFMGTETQANLYYQLSQRPLPVAVRSFLAGVTGVGLNIYLIAYLKLGYMGWFYSYFFSAFVGFLANGYSIYVRQQLWPIMRFKWARIKSSLRVSLPMVPHNLSYYLLDASDRLVLNTLQVPLPLLAFIMWPLALVAIS